MCQQHTRIYSCGHTELLKPNFCPLSMANGGAPCQPMDTVSRRSETPCPTCEQVIEEAAMNGTDGDAMDTSEG